VDDLSIITEIERLREPFQLVREHNAKYRQYINEGRLQAWVSEHPGELFRKSTLPLIASLGRHPIFGSTKDRYFGTKQLTLFPDHQVHNLLRFAAEQGAEGAVAWLHRVVAIEKADLRFVAEVHGLETHQQHTLRNGVRLMPLVELPSSAYARTVIAQYQAVPGETRHFLAFPPVGATFIVRKVPALEQSARTYGHPIPKNMVNTIKAFTLNDGAAPVLGTSWIEFVNPDPARAEFGRTWSPASFESEQWGIPPTRITADSLQWVDQYLQLQPAVKNSCDIAIERLNLARRRQSPGDKAIEGAICLEALLGDGSAQELTYKLRLRSALLLTPDLDLRREISKSVNEFYNLRSKTVHGQSRKETDLIKDAAVAKRGLDICAAALRAIVQRNKKFVPQEWELSGGEPFDARNA
jgi:hypothetical protein